MQKSEQKALKQFVHDINNSLNTISMQTELALLHSESENVPKIMQALKAIQAECGSASDTSHKAHDELLGG